MSEGLYVGIAGLLGSGKSSLCEELQRHLGWPMLPEPVDALRPHLEEFYQDLQAGTCTKTRSAFILQMAFLAARFELSNIARTMKLYHPGIIVDRTPCEDFCFSLLLARDGHISDSDMEIYQQVLTLLRDKVALPDLVIYLDVRPEVALARARKRGRSMEAGLTLDYLQGLEDAYQGYVSYMGSVTELVKVDWNEESDLGKILSIIEEKISRKDDWGHHTKFKDVALKSLKENAKPDVANWSYWSTRTCAPHKR